MIFVSVGTHEAQFDRLIKEIDYLVEKEIIKDKVIAQYGYGNYIPKHLAEAERFFPYDKTQELAKEADILITHGGPSSFIMGLENGKIPIVVPRRKEFGEHVNDHQVVFCHEVARRQHNIIVIDNVRDLSEVILNYDVLVKQLSTTMVHNNAKFCEEFEKIALNLVGGK